jgi:hypothetical protein
MLTSGGNIRVPMKAHKVGAPILRDRNLLQPEFLGSFNLPADFGSLCERFGLPYLKAGAVVPCGFSHALFQIVVSYLQLAGVPASSGLKVRDRSCYDVSLGRQLVSPPVCSVLGQCVCPVFRACGCTVTVQYVGTGASLPVLGLSGERVAQPMIAVRQLTEDGICGAQTARAASQAVLPVQATVASRSVTFPSIVLCSQLSYEVDGLVVTDWAQRGARSAAKASHRTLVSLDSSRACLPYQIQCASGMLAAKAANYAAQKLAAAVGDQNYRYCAGADMLAAQAASSAAQKHASANKVQEHRCDAGATASCHLLAGAPAVSAAAVEAAGGLWFSDAPGVLSASWTAERMAFDGESVAQPAVVDFAQLHSDALAALVPGSWFLVHLCSRAPMFSEMLRCLPHSRLVWLVHRCLLMVLALLNSRWLACWDSCQVTIRILSFLLALA